MTADGTRYFISVRDSRRMKVYRYMNILWKGLIYYPGSKPLGTGAWDTSEDVVIKELLPFWGTLREVTKEEFEASEPTEDAS